MRILLTGGCGFIGSAVIRRAMASSTHEILNIDKLTYAASESALHTAGANSRHTLLRTDICDAAAMQAAFSSFQPDAVMHLAAESHVDRSIDGPAAFIQTNLVGTFVLLEAARAYWSTLPDPKKQNFRFHHISTLHRNHPLRPPLPLFRQQSRLGPPGPRLGSHLRPAHHRLQHHQ